MTISELLPRLECVSGSGTQYSARCPAHEDKKASLSVSVGEKGVLLNCHAGCTVEQITASLGLTASDLFYNSTNASKQTTASPIEYMYYDADGKPMLKKLRYPDKSFCWFCLDSGEWKKGRNGIKPPMYQQYECRNCNTLYIVEGEKDVHTLASVGKAAVSLPDGAKSKWQKEYTEYFSGKAVAILPDNDGPGRAYAQMIADKLIDVASVRIVDLSEIWEDMPEHADITDYIAKHGKDSFKNVTELVNRTKQMLPENRLVCLADVEPTETEWLWYPYIPLGKITLLTADPGTGKTYFCLYLAATVSSGRPFWGEVEGREPGKVIYQTAEDGYNDTIVPRLIPMQPNLKNLFFIDENKEKLELKDEKAIESAIKSAHPKLMIFDPLQAYLGAGVDINRANEVRAITSRIALIAEKYNVAIIFIMHNSKMGQNQALYRALGSIDMPAIARSMLIMGKDPEDDKQKMVCHEKSSLAAHGKTIMLHIAPEHGGLVFDGFSDFRADDILNPHQKTRNKPSAKKDEVSEQLLELLELSDGAVPFAEVEKLKNNNAWSDRTLYRAKKDLEIQSVKVGFSSNKKTWWLLPDVDAVEFKKRMEQTTQQLIDESEEFILDDGFLIPDEE